MIIRYSDNNENRIEWQHHRGGEWKTAELDELIEAYERATEPGDLISRAEAIRMYCGEHCGCEPSECGLTYEQDGAEECGVVRFLKSVPSARPKGKWIPHREKSREYIGTVLINVEYDYWLCDTCGYRLKNGQPMYKYCPNCGSRMVEE